MEFKKIFVQKNADAANSVPVAKCREMYRISLDWYGILLSLSGPALNTSVLSQEPISSKRVGVSSRLNHLDKLVLIDICMVGPPLPLLCLVTALSACNSGSPYLCDRDRLLTQVPHHFLHSQTYKVGFLKFLFSSFVLTMVEFRRVLGFRRITSISKYFPTMVEITLSKIWSKYRHDSHDIILEIC